VTITSTSETTTCEAQCQTQSLGGTNIVITCDPPLDLLVNFLGLVTVSAPLSALQFILSSNTSLALQNTMSVSGTMKLGGVLTLSNALASLTADVLQLTGVLSVSNGLISLGQAVFGAASRLDFTITADPLRIGEATFGGTLVVVVNTALSKRDKSSWWHPRDVHTIPVAKYNSSMGKFSNVTTVLAYSGSACDSATTTPEYGATALSVVVSVDKGAKCGGGGLSPGAIAGIAIGAVIGGLAIAALCFVAYKYVLSRRLRQFDDTMHEHAQSELERSNSIANIRK